MDAAFVAVAGELAQQVVVEELVLLVVEAERWTVNVVRRPASEAEVQGLACVVFLPLSASVVCL